MIAPEPLLDLARRVRWRLRRRAPPPGPGLRLHLGCGGIDHAGFVNIDLRPAPHVHHLARMDQLTAIADGSAQLVYACHCLEHVSHRAVAGVLREWFRVLAPGGTVRISVPDFDLLVDLYHAKGRNVDVVQMPLMGGQDYAQNFHQVAFTFDSLAGALVAAGFSAPRRWAHGSDHWTSLPDWSGRMMKIDDEDAPVSLNVEATKPG